jgi:putative salt-induced outer membrane protein YdiY
MGAALAVFFLCVGQPAYADVLVLKNGDRITGEISRIWDKEITIEPEYSDEFTVDVPAVDHIESDRDFELEFMDGQKGVGKLAGADSDGNQIVVVGDEQMSVPLADVFELDEPEKPFDWESNVDFSAGLNSGNTDSSNSKLRGDVTLSYPDHRHLGEVTFQREELAGVTTQDKDFFKYTYNWLFKDPWFFGTTLSSERDPIVELDKRLIVSAGIGRDIWNTPRRMLNAQLGAGFQTEDIGLESKDSTVVTWVLRYRQDFFSDDLELYHNHFITSNVSGRTNTSYKTTTGLRYEITDLLYANISLDYDYETDPVDTASNEDIAILVGLGLEF